MRVNLEGLERLRAVMKPYNRLMDIVRELIKMRAKTLDELMDKVKPAMVKAIEKNQMKVGEPPIIFGIKFINNKWRFVPAPILNNVDSLYKSGTDDLIVCHRIKEGVEIYVDHVEQTFQGVLSPDGKFRYDHWRKRAPYLSKPSQEEIEKAFEEIQEALGNRKAS